MGKYFKKVMNDLCSVNKRLKKDKERKQKKKKN